ncbi:hypothetical protein [Ruegeria hyattellae]|uniref:hypothetical protein n=1 Tax=Ruegeria hyattellae TaxID=3233337 RepID=UPI00355B7B73
MRKRWVSLVFPAIAFATLVVGAGPSLAGDCGRVRALEEFASTGSEPSGSRCETFVGLTSGNGVSCYWEFPFRDGAALAYYEATWSELTTCRGGIQSAAENPVNHPDSYDIRELSVAQDIYRVTMKDKGRLNRTLVFFSFEQGKTYETD